MNPLVDYLTYVQEVGKQINALLCLLTVLKLWHGISNIFAKLMPVTCDSSAACGCEFPIGCRWRKYMVEAQVLYTDFTLCKFGHYINFGGRWGGGVGEKGETEAVMKKKVCPLTSASAVSCCQVKMYFLLCHKTPTSLSWVDLFCMERRTYLLELYITVFDLNS
jgi:hypothetical protein